MLTTSRNIAVTGIHRILVLFNTKSTITITNPANPPIIANNHVAPANNTIPETNRTALPVRAVEVPPLFGAKTDIRMSIIAQTNASADIPKVIIDNTVGTVDGF